MKLCFLPRPSIIKNLIFPLEYPSGYILAAVLLSSTVGFFPYFFFSFRKPRWSKMLCGLCSSNVMWFLT